MIKRTILNTEITEAYSLPSDFYYGRSSVYIHFIHIVSPYGMLSWFYTREMWEYKRKDCEATTGHKRHDGRTEEEDDNYVWGIIVSRVNRKISIFEHSYEGNHNAFFNARLMSTTEAEDRHPPCIVMWVFCKQSCGWLCRHLKLQVKVTIYQIYSIDVAMLM